MITFDDATGAILIDDFEPAVTIRPPKFGHLKRLRAERDRIGDADHREVLLLPALEEIPEAKDDETPEEKEERLRIKIAIRDRAREIERIHYEHMVEIWRFIMVGASDGSCVGLASPAPPENPDDWPADLIFDTHDGMRIDADGRLILQEETLLDRVFHHWGKARSRSGSTPAPTPAQ